jgi:deferrochelatase/peroxidase EfeB
VHTAPSTPGDLLLHIRAEREDMTFELERQLLDVLGDAAEVVDETTGFRYFDARDLLGFVDGTANPTGAELPDAALIGEDADPDFAGGSYVVVQKYLHDMTAWAALSTAPPGSYDRLLDFSTAVTGTTFFVPTAGMLDELTQPPSAAPAAEAEPEAAGEAPAAGSLGIGSLRDEA